MPKLSFPGGALIGCSAGFVNVPRIKGSHNAILSGILAADKIAEAIAAGRANDEPIEIENSWRASAIGKDLKRVRNVKPLWSKFGTAIGIALGGLDMWTNQLFGFSFFGAMKHGKTDAQALEPAANYKKIDYPKPDGVLTFDRLSSVFLSNTNHDETSRCICKCVTWNCRRLRNTMFRRTVDARIARLVFMNGWMRTAMPLLIRASRMCVSSSMRRTASTARPATSRIQTRISTGFRHKAAKDWSI